MEERIGQMRDHCGTPCFSGYRFDILVPIFIDKGMLNRKLLNHYRAIPCIPINSSM